MSIGPEQAHHERFGELSALAAVGQLSPAEEREWRAHVNQCALCQAEFEGFGDLMANHFPFLEDDGTEAPEFVTLPLYGVGSGNGNGHSPVVREVPRGSADPGRGLDLPSYVYVIAACLLVVIGGLGYQAWKGISLYRAKSADVDRLAREVKSLNQKLAASEANRDTKTTDLESELTTEHAARLSAEERERALQQRLDSESAQVRTLIDQVAAEQGGRYDASARLKDTQLRLDRLSNELAILRLQDAQHLTAVEGQKKRMEDLEQQIVAQTESIDRERKLLTADRDIRDLMGARNLHIIDVFDVDKKGRTQTPFGRVFYTERKSLIFYAFDLSKQKHIVKDASYQVWGMDEANEQSARSLGLFYQDDKTDSRWVMKFDDPNVLAEINSVFVTVEPEGGSQKPTGHKLMYASLASHLNHP